MIFVQVDVEVIKDAYDENSQGENSQGNMSKAFHGTEASVRKEVGGYIQKITHLPKHLEREIGQSIHEGKDGTSEPKAETQDGSRHESTPVGSPETSEQVENEREEDWDDVDDDNDNDDPHTRSAGPSSSATSIEKKRSKSPKHKPIQRSIFSQPRVSAGKRREPRRGAAGGARPRVQMPPSPTQTSTPGSSSLTEFEESNQQPQRGRNKGSRHLSLPSLASVTRPGSGTHTPHDSISRIRYDSLRAGSPSRSIRFADEQAASGSRTPVARPGTPPSGPPSGSPGDEAQVARDV